MKLIKLYIKVEYKYFQLNSNNRKIKKKMKKERESFINFILHRPSFSFLLTVKIELGTSKQEEPIGLK